VVAQPLKTRRHKPAATTAGALRPWDPASAGFVDSGTWCIADNIDTARDLERKLVIRQANVLLQIRKSERRRPPLRVDSDQAPDGKRRWIDREDQPIVVRLLGFWHELQRPAAGRQPRGQFDEGRR